jgi:hypothetical protein
VDKISILGSNYKPTLLQQIPADNLPSQFGGNCRCPGGCELSDDGPWQDPQWLAPTQKTSAPESAATSTASAPAPEPAGAPAEGNTMHAA